MATQALGMGVRGRAALAEELRDAAAFLCDRLGFGSPIPSRRSPLSDVSLPVPRLRPPDPLAAICSASDYERALHCYGRSYVDVVRAFRGRFDHPPDVVARPRNESELQATLDWALSAGAAVIPFGGGTSVVAGVEAAGCERYAGVVSIDLKALDRVLEVDPVSLSARIQAGATGPVLEEQLGAHGLTLRHFPQSFQFSTLGGWIATRAGGHFATLYTHIDDLVESVRALTPIGVVGVAPAAGIGRRRLARPDADRLRRHTRGDHRGVGQGAPAPDHRASAPSGSKTSGPGAEAVRAFSQSGLYPVNCRLIDAREAEVTGAGDGSHALLVLGFESADHDVERWMTMALECCGDHGGNWDPARRDR